MTGAELAILGLVVERPRHGYDIEQVIEERDMREWTEVGFSSIYYLLKRLEKNGWVTSRIDPHNPQGPARKVYDVTVEGVDAWHQAILDALTAPQPHYDPFQLALSSLPGVRPDEALDALRARRDALAQILAHVQGRRQAIPGAPTHVDAMFDLSMTMLEAEIGWLDRFIDHLSSA